jgi:hypothetical protein
VNTYLLRNKWDDNDTLEIRDDLYESALVRALEALGFDLLLVEEDKDEQDQDEEREVQHQAQQS